MNIPEFLHLYLPYPMHLLSTLIPGFLVYFSYGIWHSSQASYHDNITLHSLKPNPGSDVDELFDDSEVEEVVYLDEISDTGG